MSGEPQKYDLPFALGLVPIVTQNGVWIEDAFTGFAFAWTAGTGALVYAAYLGLGLKLTPRRLLARATDS